MLTIPTQTRFPTANQVPQNSILDHFDRQVYLGNQFTNASTSIVGATETVILLMQNTSMTVSLFLNKRILTVLTSGNSAILRAYLNPTFSAAGSAATIINMRPANANISKATLTTSPTVSANGTLIDLLATNAVSTASSTTGLFILDPGQVVLLTLQASASSTSVASQIGWFEL